MKRIALGAALLLSLGAWDWTGVQSKYEDDMDACQESLKHRMHKEEEVVHDVYASNQTPNGDGIKKAFNECMTKRGWNVKGEKEKKD